MKKFLSLLLVVFLIAVSAFSQSINFRHFQVENGLSYNSVICSVQDKKGFLWFGTKDGLNRFDGYSFKIFRNDPDKPYSIGHNFIHSLYEDTAQNLWVGTLTGLYKYNPINEQFTLIKPTKNKDIRDVKIDPHGNIWFIADLTLYRFNENTKKLQKYNSRKEAVATSIIITSNEELWVSSSDGFIRKHLPQSNTFVDYNVFNHSKANISTWIEKIKDIGNGSIFVGTSNQGVKIFNSHSNHYIDLLVSNPDKTAIYARDFIIKNEHEYWIATESGIFIYYPKTAQFNQLRNKFNDPYALSDNAVYTLLKDNEGGIWAGTYFGGINYFANSYTSFDKYFPQGGQKQLSGKAVREMTNDPQKNIWIGTEDGGLNKFNPINHQFEHFLPNGTKGSVAHTNIHGLLVVNNELWIGTFEHGLDVMDLHTKKVIRHYSAGPAPNQLKSNFIECLFQTSYGALLVGTSYGLYLYNKARNDFSLITQISSKAHYTHLYEDKKGTIWASTLKDGLNFFHPNKALSGSFKHEEGNKNSLSSNAVNSVFEDTKGQIWVATENGLNKRNKNNGFTHYGRKNDFPSNVFYKILEDQLHQLWISTSRGLVCYNPLNHNVKSYTKANGLLSDQFNYSSAFKDHDGRMYFGSVKGLISFLPSRFHQSNYVAPLYITGFQVFNNEIEVNVKNSPLKQSINFTHQLELNHLQSTFSIDFAALGYTAPEMTSYAFLMEGLDKEWTFLKTNRKVYFTNLSPGNYTFKVKSTDNKGDWNQQVTILKITINPPFWWSPMAILFYIILGVVMLYYTIRTYHKRVNEKNKRKIELWESKKEKELYQAKIEFFTNVTHEIRTPLTLIKGPLEAILKQETLLTPISDHLLIMKKNTNRLLTLTDQLLDFRKTEINGFHLNFVHVNISKLLEDHYLRYQSAMKERKLVSHIQLPESTLFAFVDIEALHKVISNLIDNAVKYAAKHIHISLSIDQKQFEILVKSDGVLIPTHLHQKIFEPFYRIERTKKEKGTGIGLSLARSLTELHEGTLVLNILDGIWNAFSLVLPIHHEREFNLNDENLTEFPLTNATQLDSAKKEQAVILIVEDHNDIRQFLANTLKNDFQIIEANNGKVAMSILEKQQVNLIISDIMMPEMDGFELCKAIKDNLEYTHIPLILLTAKNTLQAKIEGLEVGADAYIEKPFDTDYLLKQIDNLLESRNKMKNYFATSPLVHIKSIAYNKADESFLEKINEIINKNINNTSLDVDLLAEHMNMSRPTLYRKIKALSNLSPHELITITRLKKAAVLLLEGDHKILKIAAMTGFSSQSQFGRSFVKQFGIKPSEYRNSARQSGTN